MTATEVVLRDEMGLRVPSVSKVTVTQGSQVTFKAADGADSALYFSPATAAILSPKPGTRVDLAAGKSVTYTISSAGAGSYGVIAEAPKDPAPTRFDFGAATNRPVLAIKAGKGTDFPVPGNQPGG
jgi:hypothetical protein